jgi:hypothetical protein
MNEPLNNSHPGISFAGKTHNKHPQWYNQPLRLTKEQKRDPLPVMDDFFECYHLNDVRKTLWEWVTEVISSPCSISIEPQNRNDQIYFYEKIEEIIEAAFVWRKKIHKYRRRKEKRRLKRNNQPKKELSIEKQSNAVTNKAVVETVENGDLFNKPKQLLEYVDEAPMYVIAEVFKNESLSFLSDQLRDWLFVAIWADTAIYEGGEQRKQLFLFQDQLQILVEALFIIYTQNNENADVRKQIAETDKPRLLSQDQIANPMQVVAGLFEKFPMAYINRELNDWLEASICFKGTYPDNMDEQQTFYTYRNVLCLLKASNKLLIL